MSARVAPAGEVAPIQSITVVPIQIPITVTPALVQAFEARGAQLGVSSGSAGAALAPIVLLYVLALEWPQQEAQRQRAAEQLTQWLASNDPWKPEQDIAGQVAALLRQDGAYRAVSVGQTLALPGVESTETTWHMENWMKPRRAWYRRPGSVLDAGHAQSPATDAIVEVVAGPIEVGRGSLFLHVALKLVSTATDAVIGRSSCVGYTDAPALEDVFRDQGQAFKASLARLGETLLPQCLREAGLLR